MADDISQLEIAAKRIYLETFELVLQTVFPCSNFHDALVEKAKSIAKEYSIGLPDCNATAWLARPAYCFGIENIVMDDGQGNWSHRQPMTEARKEAFRKEYYLAWEKSDGNALNYPKTYMTENLKNAKNFKAE